MAHDPLTRPAGPESLADELLAVRCLLGEPAAFDELVDRWHVPLWRYLRRLSRDDGAAAEVLQDVWVRVLRALPALREPARLRAWLFGIARRAAMDRFRERYADAVSSPIDPETVAAPEEDADVREAIEAMHDALTTLPWQEREALVLFYLDELSLAETADVLAVPVGTVKSRLFRARRSLKQRLLEKGL